MRANNSNTPCSLQNSVARKIRRSTDGLGWKEGSPRPVMSSLDYNPSSLCKHLAEGKIVRCARHFNCTTAFLPYHPGPSVDCRIFLATEFRKEQGVLVLFARKIWLLVVNSAFRQPFGSALIGALQQCTLQNCPENLRPASGGHKLNSNVYRFFVTNRKYVTALKFARLPCTASGGAQAAN